MYKVKPSLGYISFALSGRFGLRFSFTLFEFAATIKSLSFLKKFHLEFKCKRISNAKTIWPFPRHFMFNKKCTLKMPLFFLEYFQIVCIIIFLECTQVLLIAIISEKKLHNKLQRMQCHPIEEKK